MKERNSDGFDESINKETVSNNNKEENSENEISREVVEYLMKTHPLIKDKDNISEEEKNEYTERFTKLFDTDQVKELKSSEDKKEIDSIFNEDKTNASLTQNICVEKSELKEEVKSVKNIDDEVQEIVQVVKHKPKGFGIKEVEEKKRKNERRVYSAELNREKEENLPVAQKEYETNNSVKKDEAVYRNTSNFSLNERKVSPEDNNYSIEQTTENSEILKQQAITQKNAETAAANYEKLKADFEKRRKNMPKANSKRATRSDFDAQRKSHKIDYSKEDFDVNKIEKEKNLDAFFDKEDSDERERIFSDKNRKKIFVLAAIVVVVAIFSTVRSAFLSSQLAKLNDKLVEYDKMKEENNKLKLDMLTMEEEIERYIMGGAGSDNMAGNSTEKPPVTENPSNKPSSQSPGTAGESVIPGVKTTGQFDTYTLQEGDTIGAVSTRVYGRFSYYKIILQANGLTEETAGSIKVGQEIKIPKIVAE